jgi:hypothetical protein
MTTETKIEGLLITGLPYVQAHQHQHHNVARYEHHRNLAQEYDKPPNSLDLTDEKSLGQLNEYQKGLLEEYYKLQNSHSCPDDVAENRLRSIWEEAETDPVLCKHLEFVDDLCNSALEKVTKQGNDNRAYWEEYLVPELLTKLDQEEGRVRPTTLEGSTWNIKCPDGQNLGTIKLLSNDPQVIQQFKAQICDRCHAPYGTHSWERLPGDGAHN